MNDEESRGDGKPRSLISTDPSRSLSTTFYKSVGVDNIFLTSRSAFLNTFHIERYVEACRDQLIDNKVVFPLSRILFIRKKNNLLWVL